MEAWGSCEFGVIVLSLHPFLFAHFSSLITHYPSLISFLFTFNSSLHLNNGRYGDIIRRIFEEERGCRLWLRKAVGGAS